MALVSLSNEEKNILNDYSDELAYPLNSYLVSNKKDNNLHKKMEILDDIFEKTTTGYKNTLYRGKSYEPTKNKKKCKEIFKAKYFTSTSTSKKQALQFIDKQSACCFYIINTADDVPYINMISYSKKPEEKEILLDRNLFYNVYHIENKIIKKSDIKVFYVYIATTKKDALNADIQKLKNIHKITNVSQKLCKDKIIIDDKIINMIKTFIKNRNNAMNEEYKDMPEFIEYFDINKNNDVLLLQRYLIDHNINLDINTIKYITTLTINLLNKKK